MTVTRSNGSSSDYFRAKVGDDSEDVFWHGRTGSKSPQEVSDEAWGKVFGYKTTARHPSVNVKDRK